MSYYWYFYQEEYKKVQALDESNDPCEIQFDGTSLKVPKKDLHLLDEQGLASNYEDMVKMKVLNEPEIIRNIRKRYEEDLIFTYIGPTLLVVNPYKKIPKLFNNEVLTEVKTKLNTSSDFQPDEYQPHIFVLAAQAYKQQFKNEKNQAIVISGESGAGKTENAKFAMNFLTALSNSGGNKDEVPIEDKILSCNPILEAFGNSKTVRNDNSSRFGKYVEIISNYNKKIIGAKIFKYLLEKSRVTKIIDGERNYHIFYHLLYGSNDQLLKDLYLEKDFKKYNLLNQSSIQELGNLNDKELYNEIMEGFDKQQIPAFKIWKIVAAILISGNIQFDGKGQNEKVPCTIKNKEEVGKIAKLLEVDENNLSKSLVFKTRKVVREIVVSGIPMEECEANRDSMVKNLYDRLFDWLIVKLNKSIEPTEQNTSDLSIGLLDIFGFENFKINSFEQLCINYTNEHLQQLYINYVFKKEQQIFVEDGLEKYLTCLTFTDNTSIIELLENKTFGILPIIDESCQMAKQKDIDCLKTIFSKNKTSTVLKQLKMIKDTFSILHTQSEVEYNIKDFREKNMDEVSIAFNELVIASNEPLYIDVWKVNEEAEKKSKAKFLATKFKNNMTTLMQQLSACDVHFIRCIKTNEQKKKDYCLEKYVIQQIQYLGVLQSIEIRKQGYPFRADYQSFCNQFKFLLKTNKIEKDFEENTKKIMKEIEVKNETHVLFGKTRIYMKGYVEEYLSTKKFQMLKFSKEKVATLLGAVWRRIMTQRRIKQRFDGMQSMFSWLIQQRDILVKKTNVQLKNFVAFKLDCIVKSSQILGKVDDKMRVQVKKTFQQEWKKNVDQLVLIEQQNNALEKVKNSVNNRARKDLFVKWTANSKQLALIEKQNKAIANLQLLIQTKVTDINISYLQLWNDTTKNIIRLEQMGEVARLAEIKRLEELKKQEQENARLYEIKRLEEIQRQKEEEEKQRLIAQNKAKELEEQKKRQEEMKDKEFVEQEVRRCQEAELKRQQDDLRWQQQMEAQQAAEKAKQQAEQQELEKQQAQFVMEPEPIPEPVQKKSIVKPKSKSIVQRRQSRASINKMVKFNQTPSTLNFTPEQMNDDYDEIEVFQFEAQPLPKVIQYLRGEYEAEEDDYFSQDVEKAYDTIDYVLRSEIDQFVPKTFFDKVLKTRKKFLLKQPVEIILQISSKPLQSGGLLKHDKEEDKLAMQLFENLLDIMKSEDEHIYPLQIKQLFLHLTSQNLINEVYTQIYKQIVQQYGIQKSMGYDNYNPMWVSNMMKIASCVIFNYAADIEFTFCLINALKWYQKKEGHVQMANFLIQMLSRQIQNPKQSLPYEQVSDQVLDCIMQAKKLRVSIFLAQGQEVYIYADYDDRIKDIYKQLNEKIEMPQYLTKYFALMEEETDEETLDRQELLCHENENVFQMISKQQTKVDSENTFRVVYRQLFKFDFSVNDEISRDLYYYQCLDELLQRKVDISEQEKSVCYSVLKKTNPKIKAPKGMKIVKVADEEIIEWQMKMIDIIKQKEGHLTHSFAINYKLNEEKPKTVNFKIQNLDFHIINFDGTTKSFSIKDVKQILPKENLIIQTFDGSNHLIRSNEKAQIYKYLMLMKQAI